ncbi:MAG TPA: NADH-quinone oxidoreductase subunit NuoH [Candidatus Dormibacteraeota bacterium]|nr:NADH-quinone oxidoreductase subunit NuoH [Candidatus Dormibacteraeota bacterium]
MTSFVSAHAELLITVVKIALLLFIVLTVNAYLTWFERKVVAHMQSRWGPHRVGPHGLLQPLADGLKFLFKEDPTPSGVDKFVYFLAPLLALALALTSIAVIPFGPDPIRAWGHDIYLGIADLNIGVLALFAITALGVYGVALAGWSSNSKYPLLGGLRSSAQMISYELALTLSVVGVLLIAGSFNLKEIIASQASPRYGILGWHIFPQLIGFICFFIAAVAETNRVPFDLPEAESELVAGFHTEYASFKFAMFFIAEYTSMITVSCLCSILFFGGWLSPFPATWTWTHYLPAALLLLSGAWVIWDGVRYETIFGKLILPVIGAALCGMGALLLLFPAINDFIQAPFWLLSKIFVFLFIYVWMRGTLPRLRYDQLMSFGWKILLPVSIANVIFTSFAILKWGTR